MSEITNSYKGARDFYPEDKRFQKWMFAVIRRAVEKFGYEEYDAPVLEPTELYRMKGSDEIISEQSYTFIDRGDRSVTMRTEMTPSVSRMVAARRQELAYPLRWYSIPNLWRYERPQRGRLREFWQLNVDIFGVDNINADVEIIQVANEVLKAFGASSDMYTIKINSRKALEQLLEKKGFDSQMAPMIINLFDRLGKPSFENLLNKLEPIVQQSIRNFIETTGSDEVLSVPAGEKLSRAVNILRNQGINVQPDLSLARGFDYYTDIVFEVFDNNPENNRAMFGGGRYDGLVGLFGVDPVPTVGFGMGDATLENFLRDNNLVPDFGSAIDLFVALTDESMFERSANILKLLRAEGVKTFVDTSSRKIGKQIETANKKGVRYVVVIGEDELAREEFRLKDMKTGEEKTVTIERLITDIRQV